jgi:hypothetical protein
MTPPAEVAKLLQDALDTQPTIISQPNYENLLALKEILNEDVLMLCLENTCCKLVKVNFRWEIFLS